MAAIQHIDVTIVNPAGNSIAEFQAIDVTSTTGGALKQMVVEAVGFPAAGMTLSLESGMTIMLEQQLSNMMPDDILLSEKALVVTCVLVKAQPFGAKTNPYMRSYGTKGVMMMERRIMMADRAGKPIVSCLRSPSAELRDEVRELVTSSFAPGMQPLIDSAIDAAYKASSSGQTDDVPQLPKFIHEDAERSTYADLSTCQLWTRALTPMADRQWLHFDSHVCSAVLWRLLYQWEGSAASASEDAVAAGPVLEVLFLATHHGFRREGEGQSLVEELEDAARSLGCAAMCVAAVPKQGRRFWETCGYTTLVPLKDSDGGAGSADAAASAAVHQDNAMEEACLGEPTSALGEYLLANMLLFSDTPLVGKVLK